MPFSPIPRGVYPSVTHISPSELAAKGVRLVLSRGSNCSCCPIAESPAGRRSLPNSWASPIRGTQANRKKGAISGLWSGWAAGRRKR